MGVSLRWGYFGAILGMTYSPPSTMGGWEVPSDTRRMVWRTSTHRRIQTHNETKIQMGRSAPMCGRRTRRVASGRIQSRSSSCRDDGVRRQTCTGGAAPKRRYQCGFGFSLLCARKYEQSGCDVDEIAVGMTALCEMQFWFSCEVSRPLYHLVLQSAAIEEQEETRGIACDAEICGAIL